MTVYISYFRFMQLFLMGIRSNRSDGHFDVYHYRNSYRLIHEGFSYCLPSGAKLGINSEGKYYISGYAWDGSDVTCYAPEYDDSLARFGL